jgi:hypothetical protein
MLHVGVAGGLRVARHLPFRSKGEETEPRSDGDFRLRPRLKKERQNVTYA